MGELSLVLVIVFVILVGIISSIVSELNSWNGGVCPKCGNQLKKVTTRDTSRGDKWRCRCGYTCWVNFRWITYRKIKKN